jgi:hypothetical protein
LVEKERLVLVCSAAYRTRDFDEAPARHVTHPTKRFGERLGNIDGTAVLPAGLPSGQVTKAKKRCGRLRALWRPR